VAYFEELMSKVPSLKYKPRKKIQIELKSIFVTGTAGAGKSLLTSKLYEYYTKNSAFAAVLNLDPGVRNLPYTCDIDVRDYVDVIDIMENMIWSKRCSGNGK
jgi:GTPase SAR1 family protein